GAQPSGTYLLRGGGSGLRLVADDDLRHDRVVVEATAGRDGTGLLETLQRLDGRVHDVDRVRRAERLRQDVVDAGALEDGADRTTGDNTGTGSGRTQQDDACGSLTLHGVRDGRADAGHAEEVALGLLDTLRDGEGDLAGLAVADAHQAVAVADDHESGEAEATTALHDLRDAVDGDDALQELVVATVARVAVTALAAVASATTAVTLLALRLSLSLRRSGFGHFVLLDVTHSASPPSRAPSAMAATRPA